MKNIEHQWSNITTERRAYTEQNHPFTSILSPHLVATKCLKRVLLGTAPVREHLQHIVQLVQPLGNYTTPFSRSATHQDPSPCQRYLIACSILVRTKEQDLWSTLQMSCKLCHQGPRTGKQGRELEGKASL